MFKKTLSFAALAWSVLLGGQGVQAAEPQSSAQVQLKFTKQGQGQTPTLASTVTMHYRIFNPDGSIADSSEKRGGPAHRKLAQTSPCFQEALVKVPEGSTVSLFCPAEALSVPGGPAVPMSLTIEIDLLKVSH